MDTLNSNLIVLLLLIAILFGLGQTTAATLSPTKSPDVEVLNYALMLEHLEYAFYRDGVDLLKKSKKGKGKVNGGTMKRLIAILEHEKTHVDVLTNVIKSLNAVPVQECTYDFGYKGAGEFLQIARILENVGVSAYTGAAYKVKDPVLLTAAATIATIEARHAAYLNQVNKVDPFPAAFDSPLDMRAVIGLAAGFIVSCPQNITIKPYPSLVAPLKAKRGKTITLETTVYNDNKNHTTSYCVFYSGMMSTNSTVQESGDGEAHCVVPHNTLLGDNFLFLMKTGFQQYSSMNDTGILAGPGLVFVS